jgi:hypothetical protein
MNPTSRNTSTGTGSAQPENGKDILTKKHTREWQHIDADETEP